MKMIWSTIDLRCLSSLAVAKVHRMAYESNIKSMGVEVQTTLDAYLSLADAKVHRVASFYIESSL